MLALTDGVAVDEMGVCMYVCVYMSAISPSKHQAYIFKEGYSPSTSIICAIVSVCASTRRRHHHHEQQTKEDEQR